MAHYDCLLIGHNELDFQQYYNILDNMASSGGRDHVAFIDMHLNCVEHKGRPYQAEEILTHFYNEGKPEEEKKVFYNGDCFWTAIAYLGSYLTQRGYTIDYVNLFHLEKDLLKKKLQENEYTTIALTGTMYVFEQNIYEAVSFIRKQKKNATIVAGGPYISKQAEEREPEYLRPLFRYLNADIYCYVREGEQTLTKIIDALNVRCSRRVFRSYQRVRKPLRRGGVLCVIHQETSDRRNQILTLRFPRDWYTGSWSAPRLRRNSAPSESTRFSLLIYLHALSA